MVIQNAKGIVHKLSKLVRRKKHSTLDALAGFVKLSVLEESANKTADRRVLVQQVAETLGVAEDELLARAAHKLGLPFLARVSAVNLALLDGQVLVSQLWAVGAIPLVTDGMLTGLVCIEPALVSRLGPRIAGLPLYIAAWSKIAKALDESERNLISTQSAQADLQKGKRPSAAAKVLVLMLEEVGSYQVSAVEVCFKEQETAYEFVTADQRQGRGQVSLAVSQSLQALLQTAVLQVEELADMAQALKLAGLKVEETEPKKRYRLTWQAAAQAASAMEAAAAAEVCTNEPSAVGGDTADSRSGPIMLVDDNATFLTVLQRFFARQGIETVVAQSGRAALDLLKHGDISPALIVCDLHMPEMNGSELLMQLRRDARLAGFPFIVLTSDRDIEVELRLVAEGADAFLTKNQDPRLLAAQVQRLLTTPGMHGAGRKAA